MKNSSTSFVVLEIILLLAFTLVSPVEGGKKKPRNPEDLTNFLLSPRYSQWLVGPVALIATAEERSAYLRLQEDEEATAFIVSFWDKRGGDSVFSTNGEKAIFDERAQEADRVFGEGTFRGHRTDRGTIFVLYGDPEEIRFEAAPRGRGEFMEIWEYLKEAEEGLDGKKPEKFYRFVKKDGKTTFYRGPVGRQIPGNSVRQ